MPKIDILRAADLTSATGDKDVSVLKGRSLYHMYLKRKFRIRIHETEKNTRKYVEIEVDLNYELQVTAASLSTIMKYRH